MTREDIGSTRSGRITKLMTEEQVCEYLGLSKVSLWRQRKAGMIAFRRCGGRVLYTSDDVDEFLERVKTPALR